MQGNSTNLRQETERRLEWNEQPPLPANGIEEADASADAQGFNLRPLLRTCYRKAWLILLTTSLFGGLAWYQSTRSVQSNYTASFKLLVEPATTEGRIVQPTTLTRTGGGVPNEDLYALDYSTQIQILKSPDLMVDIATAVQQAYPDNPLFSNFHADQLESLTVERISVKDGPRTEGTRILQVSFQSPDPQLTEVVLDAAADRFLRYSLEERTTLIGEGIRFIDTQLPAVQQRVTQLQAAIQQLREQQAALNPETQGEQLLEQARNLEAQRLQTRQELQEQRALFTALQRQLGLNPRDAMIASVLSQDPRYQSLLTQLTETDAEIAVQAARVRPESLEFQALLRKRQNQEMLLRQQLAQTLGVPSEQLANLSPTAVFQDSLRLGLIQQMFTTLNQIRVLETREQQLNQTAAGLVPLIQQQPAIVRRYSELQQQLDIATRTRTQLLTQREALRLESAQTQIPWVQLTQPEAAEVQGGSKSSRLILMSLMAGAILGVAAALGLEKLQNVFFEPDDLKDAAKVPMLGIIPRYKGREPLTSQSLLKLSVLEDSSGTFAPFLDAFDALYTSLRFLRPQAPLKAMVIASPTTGDGKSTIALHLAQAAALAGQRVLLVDANLHSAQIHLRLGMENHRGLSNLLTGRLRKQAIQQAIQPSPLVKNLSILTAGPPILNAARLFAAPRTRLLIERLQTQYDWVIFDAPALTDARDAHFLADYTDGIVMVVDIGTTHRSKTSRALEQLQTFHLPILGMVANYASHDKRDANLAHPTDTPQVMSKFFTHRTPSEPSPPTPPSERSVADRVYTDPRG
ncbi:GumC family protein [Trichothermofontia sp.]